MKAVALCAIGAVALAAAAPTEDEIKSLPGAPSVGFAHFSGYLNSTGDKRLHYWFVESQNDPKSDPVVLWLNGGPGCSSLDGLLYEHGPYLINDDGATLRTNPYAWNKVANVIYMEAPVGVGFSYSPNKEDYVNDDEGTATDNYHALLSFFQKFPEYQGREFFVSGESYGGIYVPTLTQKVVEGNEAGNPHINIQGFIVGNGLSTYEFNDNSLIYFAYNHGLIGDEVWTGLVANCNGSFHNPPNEKCKDLVQQAMAVVYQDGLNFYALYLPCYHGDADPADTRMQRSRDLLFRHARGVAGQPIMSTPMLGESVPCINSTAGTHYLNRDDVRRAIHVSLDLPQWSICSDVLRYNSTIEDIRPVWRDLLSHGVRGLIYNGDTDMACNFLGDEWAVDSLKLPSKSDRRGWKLDGQIAGFVKEYKGLTYTTVKGAGHMVPEWRPKQALHMFGSFLDDKPF